MIGNLSELLKQIPPAGWASVLGATIGAILGSLLGLPALLMSLRHSRKLQAQQHAHETSERIRERQMAWRRDVYLEAAETISRLSSMLGGLADLRLNEKELNAARNAELSRISRLQLIASDATAKAVNEYLGAYMTEYCRLGIARGQLVAKQDLISSHATMLSESIATIDRNRSLQAQITANPTPDKSLLKDVLVEIEVHKEMAKHHKKARLELMDQLPHEQNELLKQSMDAGVRIAPFIEPALLAARQELGIPLDASEYMRHSAEIAERVRNAGHAALQQVDDLLSGPE